jgi:AcrR family transcriptional regulator
MAVLAWAPYITRVMTATAPELRSVPARGEATRKRVLDAAVACIAAEGFQAANLSRIARHAGMTTGAIQHQFGDKATLLAEVVERGFEQLVERLARLPAGEEPLAARMTKLVEALWSSYDAASTRASLEILFAMRGDAGFHERSLRFLAGMRQRIDRLWMGTFWDAPCGRAGHVEAQRAVFATLNGLALERILVPGMPDPTPDLAGLARHAHALLEE